MNKSAEDILNLDASQVVSKDLGLYIPEIREALTFAMSHPERLYQSEILIQRQGLTRSLLIRVSAEHGDDPQRGFIVTFDDITQLVHAQRKAAWSDVARRIAHEIKNPLTPIQLSAERLQRKYGSRLTEDRDAFRTCIETIIKQVEQIERMVTEFSNFARMPEPSIDVDDIVALCQQIIFLQQQARPDLFFTFKKDLKHLEVPLDSQQLSQALLNLLQNAALSLDEKKKKEGKGFEGRITITLSHDEHTYSIVIDDNGPGFPLDKIQELTNPYITFREKGTGLGLAIVKKIVEDHGGSILLENNKLGGARVQLIFPLEGNASNELTSETLKIESA